MAILSHPAFGPRTALAYITVGSLMDVWTAVWYFAFIRGSNHTISDTTWFWLLGLFLTGLTLIILGMALGPIGQAARRAEMPPAEAANAEAAVQQIAAANPAPVVGYPPPGLAPGQPGVQMMPQVPVAPVRTV